MSAAARELESAPVDAKVEWLLRLGDDALILGHRLSEWCGHAHEMEEDLALANIGLDLLGQARLWLTLAADTQGEGGDEDQLAFLRDGADFRNLLLVEQPNGDFGVTIARQFFFDAWQVPLLECLANWSDEGIASIAAKSVKEAQYHLRHSSQWMIRLGDGTGESHDRMVAAIDSVWRYTGEMLKPDLVTDKLAAMGLAIDTDGIRECWEQTVSDVLTEATLSVPEQTWMATGGRSGRHTEHLGYLLAEMQFLQRAYPNSQW